VKSRRKKQTGLAYLSEEMWKAGCPAVLVFNFEYYNKAPGSSEALLSEAPDSLVALHRQVFAPGGIGGDLELLRALLLSKSLALSEEVQSGAAAEGNGLFRSLATQRGDVDHGHVQNTVRQYLRQVTRPACFNLGRVFPLLGAVCVSPFHPQTDTLTVVVVVVVVRLRGPFRTSTLFSIAFGASTPSRPKCIATKQQKRYMTSF
jgi:hypothetical protein